MVLAFFISFQRQAPPAPLLSHNSAGACANVPVVQVVDVGGGTGFCTLGIVSTINPENVTLIDQSPHQLEKARAKKALKGVTIMEVSVSSSQQLVHHYLTVPHN